MTAWTTPRNNFFEVLQRFSAFLGDSVNRRETPNTADNRHSVNGALIKMAGWPPDMAELMADGVGCPTTTICHPTRPQCNPGFYNYCNDYRTNSAFVNDFFMTVPQMGAIQSLLDI